MLIEGEWMGKEVAMGDGGGIDNPYDSISDMLA